MATVTAATASAPAAIPTSQSRVVFEPAYIGTEAYACGRSVACAAAEWPGATRVRWRRAARAARLLACGRARERSRACACVLGRPVEGEVGHLFPAGSTREVRPVRKLLELRDRVRLGVLLGVVTARLRGTMWSSSKAMRRSGARSSLPKSTSVRA